MVVDLSGDVEETKRFLDVIAPKEPVTFQTIAESKGGTAPTGVLHGSLSVYATELERCNTCGAGIFFMVNRGDGKGRKALNVTKVRALFLDLDGPPLDPVIQSLKGAGIEPHAVVESSPGKWHVYLLVADCALDQFGAMQKALAQRFGADGSVTDLSRVMRLPGFFHRKGTPFRSRIERVSQHAAYTVDRISEGLGLALLMIQGAPAAKVAPGGRHAHLVKVAGQMNWRGMSIDAVRAELHARNRTDCDPPKTDAEIEAIAADIMKRYAAEHGRDGRQKMDGDFAVVLMRGSDITPEPIRWLWMFWLARGKLQLLAGSPGQGKTTIALLIAATISRGGAFPDGYRCAVGSVLIWSGEDDPADTLVPRLMAMGADLTKIHFVCGSHVDGQVQPFDPARDMTQLAAAAAAIGDVSLMIVDPVVSAIAGDSHKNAEVRRGLQPLVDLASQLSAAVIGIMHLTKGTAGKDPTERVTGSIAFGAVARVVMLVAKVRGSDGTDRRIFVRAKSNLGPDDGGFEYRIEQTEAQPGISASIVVWGLPIDGTARDLLAQAETDVDGAGTGALAGAERSGKCFYSSPSLPNVLKRKPEKPGIQCGPFDALRMRWESFVRKAAVPARHGRGDSLIRSPEGKVPIKVSTPKIGQVGHLGQQTQWVLMVLIAAII